MDIAVLKFGGSSVADVEKLRNVAAVIQRTKEAGYQVAVVLSAQGKETERLLQRALEVTSQPLDRELDALLATGEQISCALGAILLHELGCPARSLTGWQAGIHTDSCYGNAGITWIDPAPVTAVLEQGQVAVVTGFQGVAEDGTLTTLGRGGSDTTAVALAGALGAACCRIYTDVDGVYTVDPRQYAGAQKLLSVPVELMEQLARHGAKVLHDRCLVSAREYGVDFEVRSSFTDAPGTCITCTGPAEPAFPSGIVGMALRPATEEELSTWQSFPLYPRPTGQGGPLKPPGAPLVHLALVHTSTAPAGLAGEVLRQLQRNGVASQLTASHTTLAELLVTEEQLSQALCLLHELYLRPAQ